jgi:hypothetical protein
MSRLEIVWRNPKASRRERRWHELACDVGRRLYLVEEWSREVTSIAGRRPLRWKWCAAAAP